MIQLPYTPAESAQAAEEWQASCGHHSIAAACNISLDAVKAACPKLTGWMSPKMISETLKALGKCPMQFTENRRMDPPPANVVAILRIQWEGPWLKPGVPAKAAYTQTHYIAVVGRGLVLDTAQDANVLTPWAEWERQTDRYAVTRCKRSTGWHFTHIWLPDQA